MNQIPENCIEKFVKSYNNYPSIIELKLNSEDIDKLTKNKTVLWSHISIIDSPIDILYNKNLVEIDSNGIYVYIDKQSDDESLVYFLFLQNYINNVNFIISKLIKKIIMELNSETFNEKLKNGEKMLVEFWAPWCGPCRILKPTFEKVAKILESEDYGVNLYTLNVEENKELSASLKIRSIPVIKSFSAGNEVNTEVGVIPESKIRDLAKNVLNG